MIIGTECLSNLIDWTDRSTCILFGDGAGAAVLQAEDTGKEDPIISVLHSDGTYEKVAKQGEAIDSQDLFFHQAYSRTPEKKVQPAHPSLWQRLRGLGKKHETGTD